MSKIIADLLRRWLRVLASLNPWHLPSLNHGDAYLLHPRCCRTAPDKIRSYR